MTSLISASVGLVTDGLACATGFVAGGASSLAINVSSGIVTQYLCMKYNKTAHPIVIAGAASLATWGVGTALVGLTAKVIGSGVIIGAAKVAGIAVATFNVSMLMHPRGFLPVGLCATALSWGAQYYSGAAVGLATGTVLAAASKVFNS